MTCNLLAVFIETNCDLTRCSSWNSKQDPKEDDNTSLYIATLRILVRDGMNIFNEQYIKNLRDDFFF